MCVRFNGPLGLSDVTLLDKFDADSQTLTPRLSGDVPPESAEMPFHYIVYADADQPVILREALDLSSRVSPGQTQAFVLSDTITVTAGNHHRVGVLPVSNLEAGQYQLTVSLYDATGAEYASVTEQIAVRWSGLDTSLYNLDEAIAQLAYIAPGQELGAIRRAPTEAERLELFREFWRKRDPTPGTERNERMEEHYYRISYANRHFGRNSPGWLSDRGQVFVLHGPPEDVQRQVYSYNNRPWEMWYYYSMGRQYVFVDKTGFGDYELVLPMWDDRTRLD